ncbi:Phenylacetic acid degradation protein PaaD, thioesterase [Klebsiella aerogenes]|nr:Phenylacetic acid degradation protein PaaD, thioesterase [Klebsiella aerogenes]
MSNDPWRNARVMYEKDTCARKMGIELIEMDDGFAQMSMTVSADMLNGHQTCHGGQLLRSPIPLSLTPVTARGWRRWLRRQILIFFVRRLPATGWSPPQESNSRAS